MFIDVKETIEVKVHYKRTGHLFVAYPHGAFKKKRFTPEQEEEYKTLTVTMRLLTWGMHNDLNEAAMVEDNAGNRKFSYKKFKESKLQRLIAGWDAKGDDGNPIPVSPTNISSLAPSIAEAILNAYDDLSMVSEQDEGN